MSETSTAQHEDAGQQAPQTELESETVDLSTQQDAEPVEDAASTAPDQDRDESDQDAQGDAAADTEVDEDQESDDAENGEDDDEESGDPLEAEGDIAADYLEDLLDIADLDGDIDTFTSGGRAHVSIVTSSEVLVGKDGEVLEALQELCRLAVMTETGRRSRLMLDVAGHRERRRKELQALAADAVAEVKESGEPVRLSPMNPFERKIVHDVVATAGLTSESEGEEPRRRVVVMTKKG